ncbi:MAG: DEAD/DEAH box helicase, partial [Candidatus Eisenbacteria bacterium]|nr:DEAD/DEAH box helicase [Candidatus Eisenbacteria bacterium]
MSSALSLFQEPVRRWFEGSFAEPTEAQRLGWPAIARGESTLLLAPTGSGKTLAAFLASIDRLLFSAEPPKAERCRVIYISPLKALAVDVERNLRAPLAGIRAVASRDGFPVREIQIAIRTGDTPPAERARLRRSPADILITTPESLYLILTSAARETLAFVETVIIDEIHSLVPTKRGAHLFVSLERLEASRPASSAPLQRIGLSATQRPLHEVARLLGGGQPVGPDGEWMPRPVQIIDAGSRKPLELRVEVPVEDMARLGEVSDEIVSGPAAARPGRASIWPSMHPRLVELIRAHRSTMIFVNSRRLAERLAGALNELAGEELVLAHHGSVARERRTYIEDALKTGQLRSIVATSSLELGIDMGAVDLVIQIEAPPSVASGLQRIGRARHEVGGTPRGIIFPKYRGDLLATAATTARMLAGEVEETFFPRNPLDVLAQQVVASVASGVSGVEELYVMMRRAAPFADLPRGSFEGVLDMLSGRYPSDEFAELKPRVTWDRIAGTLRPREGAARLAIVNAGTIPDRGLYGVFLPGEGDKPGRRVGELDEEMVFESRTGDVFLLGASSWRIEEITHDRVIVTPAPGQPGKMPFWHGDRAGRPPELGRALGKLSREIAAACGKGEATRLEATARLRDHHALDERAAVNAVAYLCDQVEATGEVPSDRVIVLERTMDEIGDWRVCILSPFGARVHAPWATAVQARLRESLDTEVEAIWSDDGIVFRLPAGDAPPDAPAFFPAADEIEDMVVRSLGGSALFASRFRENAGRALLLPRRYPGRRSPLWAQRKRSADLLAVAVRYGSFPIVLETYRECLRDVFDLPALQELLRDVASRRIRVHVADSRVPSPFAASLMFAYMASFIYDGDAPMAERRAHALSVDQAQLRELLGDAELRELLDPEAISAVERMLQRLETGRARHADGLHDLLLYLGDLTPEELRERSESSERVDEWLDALVVERRVLRVRLQGAERVIAAEDAARYRDALGLVIPPGLPDAFLGVAPEPLTQLVSRWARTHGPFRPIDVARRWGLGEGVVRSALRPLFDSGRVLEGDFLPGGHDREACDADVLRQIKRRSLARLRAEIEPVDPEVFSRFALDWQAITHPRRGLEGLLTAIEQLQGAPLLASVLESEVLPVRVERYSPA